MATAKSQSIPDMSEGFEEKGRVKPGFAHHHHPHHHPDNTETGRASRLAHVPSRLVGDYSTSPNSLPVYLPSPSRTKNEAVSDTYTSADLGYYPTARQSQPSRPRPTLHVLEDRDSAS